ncbi:MAG: putative toxin-antitoxin system toxin component, PIN family [Cyanobacteria bacterium]|nr:putative toxin-antitoxin system toxin component, PIN family [Cyanobacteriota bacterium]
MRTSTSRVVFDTNVFVSGLLFRDSVPGQAIKSAVVQATVVATDATVAELISVLLQPKLDKYASRVTRQAMLDRVLPLLTMVSVAQIVQACRDPKDDKFLEAAVNGSADVIVSGDKDLLVLDPYAGIAIVTPVAYLEHARNTTTERPR